MELGQEGDPVNLTGVGVSWWQVGSAFAASFAWIELDAVAWAVEKCTSKTLPAECGGPGYATDMATGFSCFSAIYMAIAVVAMCVEIRFRMKTVRSQVAKERCTRLQTVASAARYLSVLPCMQFRDYAGSTFYHALTAVLAAGRPGTSTSSASRLPRS